MTETTSAALPSLLEASTTTPLPARSRRESASVRRACGSSACTWRVTSLTPAISTASSAGDDAGAGHCRRDLQPLDFAGQAPGFGLQLPDGRHGLLGRRAELVQEIREGFSALLLQRDRRPPRNGFDAPHARRHAAFVRDDERPDVAGRPAMGAAAQLYRETRHGDHPHALAVLLAEQRHRAGGNRLLRRAFLGFHRLVPEDMLVDEAFNLGKLLGG